MAKDKVWEKYETHLINEGLTQLRIKKLKGMYNFWTSKTNTSIDKLKKEQIKQIITKLSKGEYVKSTGKPYGMETISDYKKFIKQFFKYLKGENNYFPPEVAWISAKIPKDKKAPSKDVLNKEEVVKLADALSKILTPNADIYKMMTLLLFDSGFRIEELMSVRVNDISINDFDKEKDKCFFINCIESKTFSRNIPIPFFTKELEDFLQSGFVMNKKKDDVIFNIHYESYLKSLKNISLKTLGKKVTPHLLRHSSATHWTHKYKLTHHQLCDRYGWAYSSSVPAIYIRRCGNNNIDSAKIVFSHEMNDLQKENEGLKKEVSSLKDEIVAIKDFLKDLTNRGDFNHLKS